MHGQSHYCTRTYVVRIHISRLKEGLLSEIPLDRIVLNTRGNTSISLEIFVLFLQPLVTPAMEHTLRILSTLLVVLFALCLRGVRSKYWFRFPVGAGSFTLVGAVTTVGPCLGISDPSDGSHVRASHVAGFRGFRAVLPLLVGGWRFIC